jgi:uncharacterized protein YcbK (DUF882 family)
MITLQVDEAYAFDYLSILEVKKNLATDNIKQKAFENCKNFLRNQLNNFDEIYSSIEYSELYKINKKTFDLVDLARNNGNVTAKEVDDANMDRFYRKSDLQSKFFYF